MKLIEPPYAILDRGLHDWSFQESPEMQEVTHKFDRIWESRGGTKGLTSSLRTFLNQHPDHIDALHHYAMCKRDEGKTLDAFAFAHTAVAIGRAVFPTEFLPGRDHLPGGFVSNRPYLRALHGLMLVQTDFSDFTAATETARELLALDPDDRIGARLSLPLYLLAQNLDDQALEVFALTGFTDAFHVAEYLQGLALFRLGRKEDAQKTLRQCLSRYPQVAHYLMEAGTPRPPASSPLGVTVGSDEEGWLTAVETEFVWRRTPGALEWLQQNMTT
jgi:tetratricopeptide (TPR) repeat protein